MPRQSTRTEDNTWLGRCRYPNCEKKTVKCKECGKKGHVTLHIKTRDLGAYETHIQHSHFVENVDAGRNMYCISGTGRVDPNKDIVESWRMTEDARKRKIELWEKRLT